MKIAHRRTKGGNRQSPLSKQRLEKLVQEAAVDAYHESEQCAGCVTMIDDNLALPFNTTVLGVEVTVERIDMNAAEEIVAICRHNRLRLAISILDLPMQKPRPHGGE